MKTIHLALAMALNLGTDPPDVVKTDPCARMECWIDPEHLPGNLDKAAELIAEALQEQVGCSFLRRRRAPTRLPLDKKC